MFIIDNVTPVEMAALASHLSNHGTSFKPVGGVANKYQLYGHEVFAYAQYEPSAKTLTVTVTKKPFFVFESHIENGLKEAIWPPVAKTAIPAAGTGSAAPAGETGAAKPPGT